MGYLGNKPAESYASFEKQVFTIVNSQTAYTLDHSVVNENDIRLVVNNVVQEPGSGKAYTASGTTLTLSAALTNGTDTMYCVFLGRALQTVNPPNASVGLAQLSATGTKNSTTFLRGDNTFAVAGGTNTPAFEANLSSTTSLSHNTITLAPFDTEVFDTDNCYDNSSNYRFTPTTAGKYFVYAQARLSESDASSLQYAQAFIYKNGSSHYQVFYDFRNNYLQGMTVSITGTIDFNGSSDYIDFRVLIAGNNDGDENLVSGATSRFGAYKIIE
jgi:hypothetical protein